MVTGMAEYIEREALLCMVKPDDPSDEKAAITIATAKKLIRNIVSRTPASDVAPVLHGRWEKRGQKIYCSECGEESGYTWAGASRYSNYCPNCGGKLM